MAILFFILVILIFVPICFIYAPIEIRRERERNARELKRKTELRQQRAASKRKADRELAIAEINSEIADFEGSIDNAKDRDKRSGPFGLECGMLKAHIQTDVELNTEENCANQNLAFIKPPKPHPLFDFYAGAFDCGKLTKIVAVRARHENSYEKLFNEMEVAYEIIANAIDKKYYQGEHGLSKDIEKEREDDALNLEKGFNSADERIIVNGILVSALPTCIQERFAEDKIKRIELGITGQRDIENNMFLSRIYLTYTFEGHNHNAMSEEEKTEANDYDDRL